VLLIRKMKKFLITSQSTTIELDTHIYSTFIDYVTGVLSLSSYMTTLHDVYQLQIVTKIHLFFKTDVVTTRESLIFFQLDSTLFTI
jgi:hypothetical protein